MQVILEDPSAGLDSEQTARIRENFRLLDRDRDGDLGEMLKPLPEAGLDVAGFCNFFTSNYRTPTSEEVLVQAFQVFDLEDSGVMSTEKFKEMLTSLGEPMPQEEVDAILR